MTAFKLFLLGLSLTALSPDLSAQNKVFSTDAHVAVAGYDLVSYFTEHKALRGSNSFSTVLDGTTYYFQSAENKSAFDKNPIAYTPQYGGHCALAMAMKGQKVPSDPTTFKLRDGKLYFFYNDFFEGKPFNTIIMWNGSEKEMLTKADSNWTKL